ncbi:MAG TPA: PDZ domain-containing protein [Blastocatellia bacterium]|nr:PDZ domain-containing protein [Blastocatellia bacterium]
MSKHVLIAVVMAAALGTSASFAQSDAGQKEKQKAKEKSAPVVVAPAATPQVFEMSLWGSRSYLGVYLEEVTAERVKELNLPEERGAVIMKVVPGSPAEKAGLKENDVIVSFNGRRVDSVRELQRLLGETPEGRNVSVEVVRGGRTQTLTATLTRRSPETALYKYEGRMGDDWFKHNEEAMKRAEEALKRSQEALEEQSRGGWRDFGDFNFVGPGEFMFFRGGRLGIGVESLTEQLGEFFGVKDGKGVLVTEVRENTPAAAAGLKAGDVITEVDGVKIDGVRGLLAEINKKPEGAVTLKVIRNRSEQTLTVTLEKNERRSRIRRLPRIVRRATVV